MTNSEQRLLSKCCKKPVITNTHDEGTSFYYCSECRKPTDPIYPDQFVDTNKKIDTSEQKYPCRDCGVLRTKEEGGTTFTVCDDCWDKSYKKPPRKKADSKPLDDCHCHQNCPGAHGGKKIGKHLSVSCLCYPRDCEHCKPMQNKSNLGKSEQMKDNKDEHNCDVMGCPSVGPHKQTKEGWLNDKIDTLRESYEPDIGEGLWSRLQEDILILVDSQQQKFEKDLREVIGEEEKIKFYEEHWLKYGKKRCNALRQTQKIVAKQLGYSVES